MPELKIKPKNKCKWDAISLGEIMIRVEKIIGGGGARVER